MKEKRLVLSCRMQARVRCCVEITPLPRHIIAMQLHMSGKIGGQRLVEMIQFMSKYLTSERQAQSISQYADNKHKDNWIIRAFPHKVFSLQKMKISFQK